MLGKKKNTYEGTKACRKPGLYVNFGQFPCSWIQIRISNKDPPDPGQSNECGSGSTTITVGSGSVS
jgi:hypothetical protein